MTRDRVFRILVVDDLACERTAMTSAPSASRSTLQAAQLQHSFSTPGQRVQRFAEGSP